MTQMVTVHTGPIWEVQLLQGRFVVDGVPAYIPDAGIKQLDPFITGAGALAVQLQVPLRAAQHSVEVVKEYITATRERRPEDADGYVEDPDAVRLANLTKLGRRVRWAAVATFTAPIAIYLGIRYLVGVRRSAVRPAGHGLTVVAFLFWLAVGAAGTVGILL